MALCKNYRIERIPRMRGFRVYVYPNATVVVKCSLRVSLSEIKRFIEKNKAWLEKSLIRSKQIQLENPALGYTEGEKVILLGDWYTIVESSGDKVEISAQKILKIPQGWSFTKRKSELQKFYKQKAISVLSQRMMSIAKETGLISTGLKFRNNRTLWGTCMPNNEIILNWKLICAPLNVIDYVIVHELVHTKIKNHSHKFWYDVERFCSNHKQSRAWLRKNHYVFDFLNDISEIHSSKLEADAKRKRMERTLQIFQ